MDSHAAAGMCSEVFIGGLLQMMMTTQSWKMARSQLQMGRVVPSARPPNLASPQQAMVLLTLTLKRLQSRTNI